MSSAGASSSRPAWTSFHVAAAAGDLTALNAALAAGQDINAVGYCAEYSTTVPALWIAADKNRLDAVKLLLAKGAKTETRKGDSGSTALLVATFNRYLPIMEALMACGADPNAARTDTGTSSLTLACEKGYADAALLLLRGGANPNQARNDGSTPLQIALEYASPHWQPFLPVVMELLAKGANASHRRPRDGATLLWLLCAAPPTPGSSSVAGSAAAASVASARESVITAVLAKSPGDVAVACGGEGTTPLQEACKNCTVEVVRHLLAAGADIKAERKGDKATALWLACERGDRAIVDALVAVGAKA